MFMQYQISLSLVLRYFAFQTIRLVCHILNYTKKFLNNIPTRMGFEPTRAEPTGLAVHRLNHSATPSISASESN